MNTGFIIHCSLLNTTKNTLHLQYNLHSAVYLCASLIYLDWLRAERKISNQYSCEVLEQNQTLHCPLSLLVVQSTACVAVSDRLTLTLTSCVYQPVCSLQLGLVSLLSAQRAMH